MTDNPPASGSSDQDPPEQFLVAGRSQGAAKDLADFEQAVRAIPGASVLSRAGRPDQPRLVVTLPSHAHDDLVKRFGTSLIIEKNARLDPM